MLRNAFLRLLVLGTPFWLAACAAPVLTKDAAEPGVATVDGGQTSGAPSLLGEGEPALLQRAPVLRPEPARRRALRPGRHRRR